jgi:hypothetical protein
MPVIIVVQVSGVNINIVVRPQPTTRQNAGSQPALFSNAIAQLLNTDAQTKLILVAR